MRTLHRVMYGHSYEEKDIWSFMRVCQKEIDPDFWHYRTDDDRNRVRPYLPHIMGWQWEPMWFPTILQRRHAVFVLLDCPTMACLWRLELPAPIDYAKEIEA